jgi:NADH:ubiquinone oxidoreductase subunit 6 (subunit J)
VRSHNEQIGVGAVASATLFVAITAALWSTSWPTSEIPPAVDNVRSIGRLLMTRFVLPFEIASVLLLAAMIGAIVIAAKETKEKESA